VASWSSGGARLCRQSNNIGVDDRGRRLDDGVPGGGNSSFVGLLIVDSSGGGGSGSRGVETKPRL